MENSKNPQVAAEKEEKEDQELFLTQLQKVKVSKVPNGFDLYQYQAFWCPSRHINGVISVQKHFQAEESDIIIASYPKSGTTWLNAITFSIVNRSRYAIENSPLLTASSHQLIPLVELIFRNNNQSPDLESYSSSTRRMFSTHVPYASLPTSILSCNCRIVYICRNPLDQFISEWQFISASLNCQLDLHEAFERACNGIQSFGPIWDHVLGYWKASEEQPDKILFLKYEDLKEDVTFYIKRIADFLGCPFSEDEVTQGVVQEIAKLCSFDNFKNLEVIKTGRVKQTGVKNSLFVRKGEVGDWKNYLTPSMSQRLRKIVEEKLVGSGLTFKTSLEEPQK